MTMICIENDLHAFKPSKFFILQWHMILLVPFQITALSSTDEPVEL